MAILSPFTRSEERIISELRGQRDRAKRQRPLPRLGAEVGKVSRRRSSPVLALYRRLGVNVKDLQA